MFGVHCPIIIIIIIIKFAGFKSTRVETRTVFLAFKSERSRRCVKGSNSDVNKSVVPSETSFRCPVSGRP